MNDSDDFLGGAGIVETANKYRDILDEWTSGKGGWPDLLALVLVRSEDENVKNYIDKHLDSLDVSSGKYIEFMVITNNRLVEEFRNEFNLKRTDLPCIVFLHPKSNKIYVYKFNQSIDVKSDFNIICDMAQNCFESKTNDPEAQFSCLKRKIQVDIIKIHASKVFNWLKDRTLDIIPFLKLGEKVQEALGR